MRKILLSLVAVGALVGPFASIANAGVWCDLQEKLGYDNVRECEDNLP